MIKLRLFFTFSTFKNIKNLYNECNNILQNNDPNESAQQIISLKKYIQNNYENTNQEFSQQKVIKFDYQTYFIPNFVKCQNVKQINDFLDLQKIPKNLVLIHHLAHIEYNAMKSYLDTAFRFLYIIPKQYQMEYLDDITNVSFDEANHFLMLQQRMNKSNLKYGDIPVHTGLLQNVQESMDCIYTRLSLISIIQEGKGVDAGDRLLTKLVSLQDNESVNILKIILKEEINHIGIGRKWFEKLCQEQNINSIDKFIEICNKNKIKIKKPYNKQARIQAGYSNDWLNIIWEKELNQL